LPALGGGCHRRRRGAPLRSGRLLAILVGFNLLYREFGLRCFVAADLDGQVRNGHQNTVQEFAAPSFATNTRAPARVTDMISLAWANAYDVAMLISADRDFVPVADFLQTKGIKVVHGAFPPKGSHLSRSCWGNLDITTMMPTFRLAAT
jgi:hypothetical protein